jgi:hypothetical protein
MATQQPPDNAFFAGVRAGIDRAARGNLDFRATFDLFRAENVVDERLARPLTFAQQRLDSEEASNRFTELFAEMLTVAVVAREAYGDPALTDPEIDEYLQQSFTIFNSFRHA